MPLWLKFLSKFWLLNGERRTNFFLNQAFICHTIILHIGSTYLEIKWYIRLWFHFQARNQTSNLSQESKCWVTYTNNLLAHFLLTTKLLLITKQIAARFFIYNTVGPRSLNPFLNNPHQTLAYNIMRQIDINGLVLETISPYESLSKLITEGVYFVRNPRPILPVCMAICSLWRHVAEPATTIGETACMAISLVWLAIYGRRGLGLASANGET